MRSKEEKGKLMRKSILKSLCFVFLAVAILASTAKAADSSPVQASTFWNFYHQLPEPVTLVLLSIGAIGAILLRKKRRA